MIAAQTTKFVNVTPPAAIVDNADFVTAVIDTAGFSHATIVAYIGATDIAMTALKVQESDDSGMSGPVDVTGLVMGTSNNIEGSASVLPSDDDDNTFQVFEVDLRGRKRYLDVVATAGNGAAGTFCAIFAILSRAEEVPATNAGRGADEVLAV